MKTAEHVAARAGGIPARAQPRPLDADPGTRAQVARAVLENGPVTATQLARRLGLTPAGIRRHLDQLLADGLVTTWTAQDHAPRGRGRPARRYVVTDAGHAAMAAAYDDLATAALQFLAETAGQDAVRAFAAARAGRLVDRYRSDVHGAGPDRARRVVALAEALSDDGYAASSRPVGESPGGALQLCQGHCPVQHVASRFPQLCEAETAAFSELLGVHVQRLSTLAAGAHVCTTHVPARLPVAAAGRNRPARHTLATQERTPR